MNQLLSFLDQNSIYIVLFILLIIWLGIYLFLLNTDKRLKKIEAELSSQNNLNNEKLINDSIEEKRNEK